MIVSLIDYKNILIKRNNMDDEKIEYFTKKLNSLKIKEANLISLGSKVPKYIQMDIRLTEIALKQLTEKSL